MAFQIACEQFIYGKLLGVRGARYELIAKSPGITSKEASEIYKGFNGYRPSATAIATFEPAYIVRPLQNGQIILLQLTRSNKKELGRGYFLQEHYVRLNPIDVTNNKVKLWLWLLSFSLPSPSFVEPIDNLPNYIQLNEREIQEQINNAIKLLSKDNNFQRSVINALHYILYSRPIGVSLHKDISFNWVWLTALSFLLPNSEIALIRLYIGQSLPPNCESDISVVDERINKIGIFYLDYFNQSDNLLTLAELKKSYTKLSLRCLKTNDLRFLNDLISSVESVDIQKLPSTPTTPLDVLLWASAMPAVGLPLARKELKDEELSIDDLQWLWRKSIDNFTVDDVKIFLPILINQTSKDWGDTDFSSLRKLIDRLPNTVTEIIINSNIVPAFIEKWLSFTNNYNNKESEWMLNIIESLLSNNQPLSVDLLIKWIYKAEIEDLFTGVLQIVQKVTQGSALNDSYWELFLVLGKKVENEKNLITYLKILHVITIDERKKPLYKLIYLICDDGTNGFKRSYYLTVLWEVFNCFDKTDNKIGEVLNVILLLSFRKRKTELIISIAVFISQYKKVNYLSPLSTTNEFVSRGLVDWILLGYDNELMGSFVYIVGKIGLSDFSEHLLLNMLKENPDRFLIVERFFEETLNAQRSDLKIAFSELLGLSDIEQLNIITRYILSTEKLPYTTTELMILEELLIRIKSIDGLKLQYQNWLLNILWRLKYWFLCQRILEHQIRTGLRNKDIDQCMEKLLKLRECIDLMGISYISTRVSRVRAKSIITYFRALPVQKKQEFLAWLIEAPLGTEPKIERTFLYTFTSVILENKSEWFLYDPIVRFNLFTEAITVIRQRSR